MTKTKTVEQPAVKKERSLAIDRFRGFAILIVVVTILFGLFVDVASDLLGDQFATTMPFMAWVSKLFGHATEGLVLIPNYSTITGNAGLALADLFAPMFLFIVGLTLVKSFKSHEEKVGTKRAYLHLATRFLGLIAIGSMLNGLELWTDFFANGEVFGAFELRHQIMMIALPAGLALVAITLIVSLFKNKKLTNIFSKISRYLFAALGVLAVFFVIVRGAEIISGEGKAVYGSWLWDILQNIGLAGLVALPFVKMDKWGRLVIVGLILGVSAIFVTYGGSRITLALGLETEGGLFGCLGAASIVLLGSVFEDFKKNKWLYFGLVLVLLGVGLWLSFGPKMLIAKWGATATFAMITAGVSALVYAVISLFDKFKPKFAFFTIWGSNSLLTYTTAYILGVVIAAILTITETVMPLWAAISITVALLAIYTVGNWALYRKQKFINL